MYKLKFTDWKFIYNIEDIELAYSTLLYYLTEMYHSFSLINKIKSSSSKNKFPWIYKSIKKEILKINKLYNTFISNSCQDNKYAYSLFIWFSPRTFHRNSTTKRISDQLVMLDISSAFDTLNHKIILPRLHILGVKDLAISWFTSYLSDRSSSVKIYHSFSSPSPMKYGVPQGLILGPSLFSIYLYPLPSIISKYPNIYYHIYADDIQIYMFLPTNSSPGLNNQLSNCANDIKEWLISNNLSLITPKLHC